MVQRTVSVGLVANVSNYVANMERAAAATRKTAAAAVGSEKQLRAQGEVYGKLGTAALAGGALAAAGLALVVKATSEYQAKMAQLQSLSKASAADMKRLSAAAMEQGKAYGYSASQVAEAEIELTKAGLSTADILGGGLKSALSLAAAGQLDVGKATEIATIAMTDFGLSAKDLPHVADELAAGADKALGSVADLGEGLANGGQQAHNMGLTITDTIGTLSAFANAGIIGAEGGTQLRSMFIQLQHPTKQAQDVLDKYGISIYDTSGKFVGMTKLAGELSDKLGTYSQAQQNAALATVFGSHAITGASVIMALGAKGMQSWIEKVNDYGFANVQAAGKMNSLQGDAQKLSATFETDLIKAGTGANDVLRGVVQTAGHLVDFMGDVPAPVLTAGLALTAAAGAVSTIGGAALVATPRIAQFRTQLAEAGVTGKSVGVSFAKGAALSVGIAALTAGLAGLSQQGQATKQSLAQTALAARGGFEAKNLDKLFTSSTFGGAQDGLKNALDFEGLGSAVQKFGSLNGLISGLSDTVLRNEGTFDALGQQLSGLAQQDLPAAQHGFAGMVTQYHLTADQTQKLLGLMPAYRDTLADLAAKAGVNATQANLLAIAQGKGAASAKVLANEQQAAAASSKEQQNALQALAGAATDGTVSVKALKDAIESLDHGQLSARDAARNYQQAIDDATTSLKKNGRNLDITTQAGRDNQAALDNLAATTKDWADKLIDAGATQGEVSKVVRSGRAEFVRMATNMGMSRDAAKKLAESLFAIPKVTNAQVNVLTAAARAQIAQIQSDLAQVKNKSVTVTVNQDGSVGTAYSDARESRPKVKRAAGGAIDGPGPKGKDSVDAVLAPGEHVLTADDVDAMGGQPNVYRFRTALHMAKGGAVPDARGTAALQRTRASIEAAVTAASARKKIEQAAKSAIQQASDAISSATSSKASYTTQLAKAKRKLTADNKAQAAAEKAYQKAQDAAAAISGKGTSAAKHTAEMHARELKKQLDAAKKAATAQQKTVDSVSKKLDTATQQIADQTQRRTQLRNDAEDFQSTQRRATADNPIDPMSYVDQLRSMSRDDNYSTANRKSFDDAANKYEATLVDLATKSAAAAKKLSDLKDASTQMTSSITQAIAGRYASSNAKTVSMTSTGIVRDGISFSATSSALSAASLDSYWKTAAIDTEKFASQLQQLAKRGVNAQLLAEIAQDANGPQLAAALLAADPSQLASISSNYAATQTNAATAGQTVADANYADLIAQAQTGADQITAEISADGDKLRKLIASAFGLKGYATGTPSATPGLHRVAENGMELVTAPGVRLFDGHERVYTHAQTASYIRGGGSAAARVRAQQLQLSMPSQMNLIDADGVLITRLQTEARGVAQQVFHAEMDAGAVRLIGA